MSPNGSKEPLKSKLKNLMPKPNGAQNELKTPELAHIAPGELASLDVCTIKTGCGIEVWGYRTL